MANLLITSGPTRQFIDPVRYLTNASSGRMGAALAAAALGRGHRVTIISGPVQIDYPAAAQVVSVLSTDDMLTAAVQLFPNFDGLIGAAAPCDYQPVRVRPDKIAKDGQPLLLELIETPDVVASVAARKTAQQWVVGFALETEDRRFRSIVKMQRKCCDLMVSNGPAAIDSPNNDVEILAADGSTIAQASGSKQVVAEAILDAVDDLIDARRRQQLTPELR